MLSNISRTNFTQVPNLNISPLTLPPQACPFPATPPPFLFLDSSEAISSATNLTSDAPLSRSLWPNINSIPSDGSAQNQNSTNFMFSLVQTITAEASSHSHISTTTSELVTTSAESIELLGLDELSMEGLGE